GVHATQLPLAASQTLPLGSLTQSASVTHLGSMAPPVPPLPLVLAAVLVPVLVAAAPPALLPPSPLVPTPVELLPVSVPPPHEAAMSVTSMGTASADTRPRLRVPLVITSFPLTKK